MTEKIEAIVPVAPGEPTQVIKNSINHISNLEVPEGIKMSVTYVIDSENEKERDIEDQEQVNMLFRRKKNTTKAGAINDVLEGLEDPEYVAIFDVDSRPDQNFLTECLKTLKNNEKAFMSSSPRKIINSDRNWITELVETEFLFFNDIQKFFNGLNAFNHFNGPIAVIDGGFAVEAGFNEDVICEDTDFTERGYLECRRAVLNTETSVGEQAVTNLADLYSQKLRWMAGAREGLENYFIEMWSSENPMKVKISWFNSMFLPFFAFLFSPLSLIYAVRIYFSEKEIGSTMRKTLLLFFFAWFISFCGLVVIKRRLAGESIEWSSSERENL